MDEAREEARGGGGWGTAVALLIAVSFLSVFYAFPLVAFPLAVLLLALPGKRHGKQVGAAAMILALALLLPGGELTTLSRGWALLLGSALLLTTLLRPTWGVLPRSLAALALGLALGAAGLTASGAWGGVDWMLREHYQSVSTLAAGDLSARMPDSAWAKEFQAATARVASLQWFLFPAILGLQSLAALALACWWVGRFHQQEKRTFELRPLREFRFHDQLIWVVIAGLLLVALPLGEVATRIGYNALFFMGALYALRGVGIFLFLAGRAPSVLSILLGTLAAIFLYPLILTAVLVVGLGDTWLDVRRRATLAPRA